MNANVSSRDFTNNWPGFGMSRHVAMYRSLDGGRYELCFLFDQYFNQMHTLYPCQTIQNQYKYNNHNKHSRHALYMNLSHLSSCG